MRVSNAFTGLQLRTVKPVASIMTTGIDFTTSVDGSNPELHTELTRRGNGSRTAALAKEQGVGEGFSTRFQLVDDQGTSRVQAR